MGVLARAACPVEAESRAFTDQTLAQLRAEGWAPAGWARFARNIGARSSEQVAAHPRAAAEVTLLHGVFLAAARGRGRWWVTTSWAMAITHLGLLGRRRSIGWPNAISLARANLVVTGAPLGRWLGVVAGISDKADGMLARRQGPTMFGFYADSLADAAFWTWLGSRRDQSRLVLAASVAAWAAPVAAVAATSIAKGQMVESPRPALLRPAAALQAVLAVRALRTSRPQPAKHPTNGIAARARRVADPSPRHQPAAGRAPSGPSAGRPTRRTPGVTTAETTTPARKQKVDRDEVFLEYTKSICPVCKVVIDAQVNIRDNKVFLRKRCPTHGPFEALLYSDAQMYMDSMRFNKPGTIPLETQTEVVDGCPLDCGLCPEHKQHACLGIIEVNTGCNLDCPICFADSGHQPDGFSLTLDQVEAGLDAFVRSEGEPEVVMFSGGEPTIHPQILDFLRLAADKGVRYLNLNTNGLRLAHDRKFMADLAGLDKRPNIYLQFDGLTETTHLAIRGRDLRAAKQAALDACAEHGLTVTLVAAIERGLNEGELGDIVRFGIAHPAVRSVAFQPVTHSGRHLTFDPLTRLTNADVVHGLVDQCPDWFRVSDFFPVPCCFPTCRSITYLLVDGDTVVPIPRLLNIEEHLDYVTNRVVPDLDIRHALEKLWSASAIPGTPTTAEQLECATCGIDLPDALRSLTDKAFMIVIQDFQDPYTLNVKQLMKCCVEEITPDGRLIPFCAYNSVGYREQVREQLSGVAVPTIVPNAGELAPVLLTTRYGSKTTARSEALPSRDSTNTGTGLR